MFGTCQHYLWQSRHPLQLEGDRWFADSPLEEGGFELSVPGGNEPADCPLALAPRDLVAR